MLTRHTITLHRNQVLWSATFSDPEVRKVCGTDTLPTPFRAVTAPESVLAAIQARNPDCRVFLGEAA